MMDPPSSSLEHRVVTADNEPLLRSRIPSSSYTINDSPTEPQSESSRVSLHLPGRIIHISVIPGSAEDSRCCGPHSSPAIESQSFSTTWSDYSKFEEIKLSSKMISDHMPYRVADILKCIAQQESGPESLRFWNWWPRTPLDSINIEYELPTQYLCYFLIKNTSFVIQHVPMI